MTLVWFTAGVVLAGLLGVYLPWSAWLLPAGLGCLAVLKKQKKVSLKML